MTDKQQDEITVIVGRAKHLLDYASADCSECGCPGASFGHGSAVEVEKIVERLADLALRQPTPDAMRERVAKAILDAVQDGCDMNAAEALIAADAALAAAAAHLKDQ